MHEIIPPPDEGIVVTERVWIDWFRSAIGPARRHGSHGAHRVAVTATTVPGMGDRRLRDPGRVVGAPEGTLETLVK